MVGIRAENLSLTYRLRPRLTLSRHDRRLATAAGLPTDRANGTGWRRGYIRALQEVSFELRPGDRLALVGANGAGKTTLLKVLYGILEPTTGSVDCSGRIDALFNINLGFRREATGRRNIELRGLINGWTREQIAARMDEVIEFSELGEFINLPFKAYSQGMAARLAFATATAFDPEILLMDEWIGAGDQRFQEKAQARLSEIVANAGITVLASHNHSLLERTCNKVLELEDGRVKYFGKGDGFFDSLSTDRQATC